MLKDYCFIYYLLTCYCYFYCPTTIVTITIFTTIISITNYQYCDYIILYVLDVPNILRPSLGVPNILRPSLGVPIYDDSSS